MSTRLHVRPAVGVGQYPPGRAVEVRLAHLLGCGVGTAHQRLYGTRAINAEAVAAVTAFRQAGQLERLDAWSRPLRAALDEHQVLAFSTDLVLRAQEADTDEDLAEKLFDLSPTPENRAAWIKQLRREAFLLTQEADALEAQSRSIV